MSPNIRVFAVAGLLSLVAVLAFGLVPALRISRIDVAETLKLGWTGSSSRGRGRLSLVAGQIVLVVVLLVGAGLLTKSFGRVASGGLLDATTVAVIRLRPRLIGYSPEKAQRYVRGVVDTLRRTSGVRSVVPVASHLMPQVSGHAVVSRPGETPPSSAPAFDYFEVGPGFFETFHIPLLAGREFTERDSASSPLVAMVTESMARRLAPEGHLVGQAITLDGKKFEVVGIAKDYRWHNALEPVAPMAFTSYWQNAFRPQVDAYVAIGLHGAPGPMLEALRRTAAAVDANVPVTQGSSMLDQIRDTFTQVRLGGAVLAVGAALALFLSAIGLYGVISFLVTQRTREIGVRLAVGARPSQVVALLVREGLGPISVGGLVGLVASLALAPLLSRWLFDIAPFDAASTLTALGTVTLVALVASYIPARRAARTDPAAVFRYD